MITQLEVHTLQGTQLVLPLDDISSGIVVQGIDGLDPVKATLVSSNFAGLDGAQYQTSRREPRNIKLSLGLEPDYVETSVQDLRNTLYLFLMPKSEVTLRFIMSDGLSIDIVGRVESFDSTLFDKEPSVDISFMCFDPDFHKTEMDSISGVSTDDEESLGLLIPYTGSVETGMLLSMYVSGDVSDITIYNRPPDNSYRSLDFSFALENEDRVDISTVTGNKYARVTRDGVTVSALYGVSQRSNWILLLPGDNYLKVYVEGSEVQFSVQYTTRYGGL